MELMDRVDVKTFSKIEDQNPSITAMPGQSDRHIDRGLVPRASYSTSLCGVFEIPS